MNDHFFDFLNIGLGAFYIAIAFLCRKHPQLIAGNNDLFQAKHSTKRPRANEAQVRTFFRGMLTLGLLSMVLGLLLWPVGNNTVKILATAIITPVAVISLIICCNRKGTSSCENALTESKTSKSIRKYAGISAIVIVFLSAIFSIIVVFLSSAPQKVILNDDSIEITGIYGKKIELTSISDLARVDRLPQISHRTNGASLSHKHRGEYATENGESIELHVDDQLSHFIKITLKDGKKIYLTGEDDNATMTLFSALRQRLN